MRETAAKKIMDNIASKIEEIEDYAKELFFGKTKDNDDSIKIEKENDIICLLGHNIPALDYLKKEFLNKINIIYLDPPYNSGYSTVYYDNYETVTWASMISNVLEKIKDLCDKELCVLFISIDNNMEEYIKWLVKDKIPEMLYYTTIVWKKNETGNNINKRFSENHEYIFVFANKSDWIPGQDEKAKEEIDRYKNYDNDPRGPWKKEDLTAPKNIIIEGEKERYYPIYHNGRAIYPRKNRVWRYKEDKMRKLIDENRVYFPPDGEPFLKVFLSERPFTRSHKTVWEFKGSGSVYEAKKESLGFYTPKPIALIEKLIGLANIKKDIIVLDPFAGSGTTAIAALRHNKKHSQKIQCIIIELDHKNLEIIKKRIEIETSQINLLSNVSQAKNVKTQFILL